VVAIYTFVFIYIIIVFAHTYKLFSDCIAARGGICVRRIIRVYSGNVSRLKNRGGRNVRLHVLFRFAVAIVLII